MVNNDKANSIIKVNPANPGVEFYGYKRHEGHQMVNPNQQSRYENNNYISLGRHQYKENGVASFDRGYNCGHGVNYFGYYRDNPYQYGLNGVYSVVGYRGNKYNNLIKHLEG